MQPHYGTPNATKIMLKWIFTIEKSDFPIEFKIQFAELRVSKFDTENQKSILSIIESLWIIILSVCDEVLASCYSSQLCSYIMIREDLIMISMVMTHSHGT